MVGVQVRVDDDVDVSGVDLGPAQCAEEVGLQVRQPGEMRPLAVVSDAGVDDDGEAIDLDHPALHDDAKAPRLGIQEGRDEQVGVFLPSLRGGFGE